MQYSVKRGIQQTPSLEFLPQQWSTRRHRSHRTGLIHTSSPIHSSKRVASLLDAKWRGIWVSACSLPIITAALGFHAPLAFCFVVLLPQEANKPPTHVFAYLLDSSSTLPREERTTRKGHRQKACHPRAEDPGCLRSQRVVAPEQAPSVFVVSSAVAFGAPAVSLSPLAECVRATLVVLVLVLSRPLVLVIFGETLLLDIPHLQGTPPFASGQASRFVHHGWWGNRSLAVLPGDPETFPMVVSLPYRDDLQQN